MGITKIADSGLWADRNRRYVAKAFSEDIRIREVDEHLPPEGVARRE
ncbi:MULTISPECIES: hypothetical protein [Bradyrhizobium]|nr:MULTISPECIES: hypothetical protein [Bradyrhizobium]